MVRISKIEMTGRKRMKRKSSVRNNPMVPTNIDQSQTVGVYMPHDDGRKSLCRLVTTITKRSSHMPTPTTSEIRKSASVLCLIFLIQRNCGVTTLHKISAQ